MNNLNWEKIEREYPKAYEKFLKYNNYRDGMIYIISKINKEYEKADIEFDAEKIDNKAKEIFFNDICFCDIVNFFDEQGIMIFTTYINNYFVWIITSNLNLNLDLAGWNAGYKTRQEAQKHAIEKGFEILEKQIQGVKRC